MRLTVLLLFFIITGGLFAFSWYNYYSPGPLTEPKTVMIPRGAGFHTIATVLADEQVIAHPLLLDALAIASGKARKLKAGEYAFPAGATLQLVIDMIATGKVVVHKITVPEGLRILDVLELLNADARLTGAMLVPEEGSLLPQTYHFHRGDYRNALLSRMQSDMQMTLAELWPKRKEGLPIKTPQEALTLASIVEKETSLEAERERVAAVFINRLRLGMPLQSDPTTVYAIERDKGPMGRALLTADLAYDSPYNTYKVNGLPPGPICNPGRAALEAVLNPIESNELYFVATGDGGHNFAASLKEHNENVKKYRAMLKRQSQP
jgi:UPF0755 protein